MTTLSTASGALFRARDLFVHDGSQFRRIRLSSTLQLSFALAFGLLLAFSLIRFFTPAAAAAPVTTAAVAAGLGQGGPLEPIKAGSDSTFKQLFSSFKKLGNFQTSAIAVPSEKPVRMAAFTSGYGVRSDPFGGGVARHMGIDLAGPTGTPIYATADGMVSASGYNSGGYGNLIKLDHGRGVETRYGHLSALLVSPGQRVARGQLIGRMGSTGRSTGSHLHYEVRIEGKAVNPIPFMKSTDYLLAMQKSGAGVSMDAHQVALGGPPAAARR